MKKISIKKVGDKFILSIDQPENPEDLGVGISLSKDDIQGVTFALVQLQDPDCSEMSIDLTP